MLNDAIAYIRAFWKELNDRRAMRELLEKDDRMLRDVGLTRADVESALMKPFGVGARSEAYRLSRLSLLLDQRL